MSDVGDYKPKEFDRTGVALLPDDGDKKRYVLAEEWWKLKAAFDELEQYYLSAERECLDLKSALSKSELSLINLERNFKDCVQQAIRGKVYGER